MDGKDAESLAESATLVEDDLVARSCTSSISEAATEKQDVEYGKTSSKAGPDAPSVTRELEPTINSARRVPNVKEGFPLSFPQRLAPSFLLDALRKPFSRSNDALQRAVDKSKEIDHMIERDKAQRDRTTKVLLLGAGDAGKSTFLKQMTRLFKGPPSIEQRKEARENVLTYLIRGCRIVIEEMEDRKIKFDTPENEHAAHVIMNVEMTDPVNDLPTEYCAAIRTLGKDKGLLGVSQDRHRVTGYESISYFFENLERITQPAYMPDEKDMLLCKTRLFGITERYFRRESTKQDFYMYDLGGSRGERKKWIHLFEETDIAVVVMPIDTYHQRLFEDSDISFMQESLVLFDSILNSRCFKQRKIVLLLTKLDRLADALKRYPIQDLWPDFVGDPQSEEDVIQFFTDKALSYNTDKERQIVVKALSLIDTEMVHQFLEDEILKPPGRTCNHSEMHSKEHPSWEVTVRWGQIYGQDSHLFSYVQDLGNM